MNNGRQAIELIQSGTETFDIIISGLICPLINGDRIVRNYINSNNFCIFIICADYDFKINEYELKF